MPFGGHLKEENRWVILSGKVPWKEIENGYKEKLGNTEMGAPAKPLRMALGSLIIKEKLQISDREVVEQIRENLYLQFFVGTEGYENKAPFDSSMAGRNFVAARPCNQDGSFPETARWRTYTENK